MSETASVIVVGAGPIGSAAARHLAAGGHPVTIIGPEEPPDFVNHRGLWSGHYDQGRCAAIDVPLVPSLLGLRAMKRFPELQAETGIQFARSHPVMNVFPEQLPPAALEALAGDGQNADDLAGDWLDMDALLANVAELGGKAEVLDEKALLAKFPDLRFPPGHVGVYQEDAFIVNPRSLVRAELAAAAAHGAKRLTEEVTAVDAGSDGVVVHTRQGNQLRADAVLLATGASTNACRLLPRKIAAGVYGCTIVLLEVSGPDAADFPTMLPFLLTDDQFYGGIIVPPLEYPDGRWYIKATGADLLNNPLDTYEEIEDWVRTGGSEQEKEHFLGLFADLMPTVGYSRAITRPCLPTLNASQLPYIGFVDDHVALATEGERGVMMADEIGRLAARLVSKGRWDDPIPGQLFEVQFE